MIDIDPSSTSKPKFRLSKFVKNLILIIIGMLMICLAVHVYELKLDKGDNDFRGQLGELQVSTSQLVSLSKSALTGDIVSFKGLNELRSRMDTQWAVLKTLAPTRSEKLSLEIVEIEEVWSRIRHNTQVITENEADILLMRDMAITLNEALPHLQAEHANLVEIYLDEEASAEQVSLALRQSWFAERIGRNLDRMLVGGVGSDAAADKFYSDASRFGKVLESMKTGNSIMGIAKAKDKATIKSLKKSTELFSVVQGSIKDIFDRSPAVSRASLASNGVIDGSPLLLARLILLNEKFDDYQSRIQMLKLIALSGLSCLSLLLMLIVTLKFKLDVKKYLRLQYDEG